MEKWPTVLVCHPCTFGFTKNFYVGMLLNGRTYPGPMNAVFSEGLAIQWARNMLVEQFLESGADYLFFVDTDTGVPEGGLKQLILDDKDIVSGLYFTRTAPFLPVMKRQIKLSESEYTYQPVTDYPEAVIPVDATGCGCLLIKRDVFAKMPKPWFLAPRSELSEDIYFMYQAKRAGLQVYVDTRVKCLHDTEMAISEDLFKANKGVPYTLGDEKITQSRPRPTDRPR